MSGAFKPTDSQQRAINRLDGRLFIAAGAGSGKTAVVANRFVEAIARGKAEVDQILTITFTKKAAAEMMKRVRKVLRERIAEDPDPERAGRMKRAYRDIENACISTNDSFYSRVLRANALAAEIDPEFTVADEARSRIMREEAWGPAVLEFVERNGQPAADLILAYDPKVRDEIFKIINGIYKTIRTRGGKVRLPVPDPIELFTRSSEQLLTAIDEFEEAVKSTGASYETIDTVQETNWKLRAACSSTRMDVRWQMLEEGKPCAARGGLKAEIKEIQNAREACITALHASDAVETMRLMGDLLQTYDRIYSQNKYNAGVLDFADLSLLTRDLLVNNKSIRDRLSSGFKMIMVDEYQDTNRLQAQITSLITSGDLMMVGDENQSIFGFRDAEVELFREEDRLAEAGDYRIPLVENFRSQPEILAFVDAIFKCEEMLGSRYLQLHPMAEIDKRAEDSRVEIIMVDSMPPSREKLVPAAESRKIEAQLIAERLRELHGQSYSYGDMAIIMATRTDAETYRQALDNADISSYLAIGISYFGRLELGDTINLFRLLVNPLDDEALVAVLRSPLVGVSDDALYWLRQAAGRDGDRKYNPLWTAMADSGEPLENATSSDGERLMKFAADLDALRSYAGRHSLQDTSRKVLAYNDFAGAMASCNKGKQALANLMKLIDLAADFEDDWGRDLVAFTEFLGYQKSREVREADAPIEEEGVDSVRIMTMHSAKGLEFPLVVLPKLGDERGSRPRPKVLLDRNEESGRVGLLYRNTNSKDVPLFYYDDLAAEKAARELEEKRRLIYVAMTRAKRHLILAGCTDLEQPGKGMGEGSCPLDWIRDRLALDRKSRPGLDGLTHIDDIAGANIRLQICTEPDEVLARADATKAVHEAVEASAEVNSAIMDMPVPAIFVPPTISATSLDAFNACPRRYHLDRVLGIGRLLDVEASGRGAVRDGNLNAMEMGTLVHQILERDLNKAFDGSMTPADIDAAAVAMPTPADADHKRVNELLANFRMTPVAADLLAAQKTGRLQKEFPFSTLVGQTVVQGFIDAILTDGDGGTLVVDYKTGSLSENHTLEQATATYKYQMAAYALAAARHAPGPVRVALVFLGGDEPVESVQHFVRDDIKGLEQEIKALIDSMAPGDFPPVKEFDAHQCQYCTAGPSGAGICQPGV